MDRRIAFLNFSTGWGGLEMNVIKLCRLFRGRGYEVNLIASKESSIYKKGSDAFSSIYFVNRHLKYVDLPAAAAVGRYLKQSGISTVMVFDNNDLDIVFWIKSLFYGKLKVYYQQHKLVGITKKDFIHTMRFNSIDVWITPTEFLKKEILANTAFSAGRIRIVPLCCNISQVRSPAYSREDARAKLNIRPQSLLIGSIGRISRKKGQLFLVHAVSALRSEGVEVELLIVGSPTIDDADSLLYYNEIKRAIESSHLSDYIYIKDHTAEVSLFYSAVDIFVLPSENETYGMVTIEAMLSGVPVLATDSGSTRELLDNENFGKLFRYNDYAGFRDKLLWLILHPEQRAATALRAKGHAEQKYDQENEIEQIDKILQE